jgi:predicted RNase H-like HicB family nuclease
MLEGMKVSAVLTQTAGRWLAHCQEVDRVGEGDTPEQALASLREGLAEYFQHAQAVAPPSEDVVGDIDIEVIGAPYL